MNLETSRVEQNEQVKAVDFDFAFESIASNIALAIRRIVGQTESDILIGGVVTAAPGSSMNIIISEILASGLNSFALDTEQIGPIGVSASTTADRRDIVQVRGVYEGYDSKQRGFYDTDTDIVTYAFIDTKKKLAVEVSVKAGVPGSVSAPTTDEGYIKIAEILIPAGSINITDENIFNVTADISGMENVSWKTEKTKAFRVGGINDIKTLFRVQHEASGEHKDNVIGANSIKIGNAQNFLNGSIIPNGASALIGSETLPATTTIPNMIASVLAYINAEIADRKKLSEITTQVSSDMTLGSFEKNTRRYLFNPSENNITITMKAGEKIKEDASFVLLSKELAGIEKISETGWVFVSRNLVDATTVLGLIPGTRGLAYLQAVSASEMGELLASDISGKTFNATTATKLQTARKIGGVSFDGSAEINLPGVNTAGNQATSGKAATAGNADTATKLQTARTIGGVSFDGSANINLPGVNAAGNQATSGKAATAGTADTANAVKSSIDLPGNPTTTTQAAADSSTKIATTAFVKNQSYAPLASPALTGTPTAPTPATATNNTQIATTAFVKNQKYEPNRGNGALTLALGNGAVASENGTTAIGVSSKALGLGSTAFGVESTAIGAGAIALGSGATAPRTNQITIGDKFVYLNFASTETEATVYNALSPWLNPIEYGQGAMGSFGASAIILLCRLNSTTIELSHNNANGYVVSFKTIRSGNGTQIGSDLAICTVKY